MPNMPLLPAWKDREVFTPTDEELALWRAEIDHDCHADGFRCRDFKDHRRTRCLISRIDRSEAELLRLCGPICPHDQKRAIEHLIPEAGFQDGYTVFTRDFLAHPPAAAIAVWLIERSAR